MKFTLSWLKDHLETDAALSELTAKLTAIGLEVETAEDRAEALAAFTVAAITEAVPHPNADKLRICQVDDGAGIRQVVCGAPNARAGIKVALATEGVKIPANGMVIKKSMIRGVESNGMLCSARELGIGEDGGGIIELPEPAIIGENIAASLGLSDPVIDIAVTPNRADALGVRGIARDLAAAGLGTLKPLAARSISYSAPSPVSVTLLTPLCPHFVGCHITGVRNGPSPEWLQQRLRAIGLRPISALVDITNYMAFTFARPLHVFDADALEGGLTVRMAAAGESFAALNDKTYTLTPDMLVVADAHGVAGLAGVMGGARTACSDGTTAVFLEAAWFAPAAVAATGRALALDSDARYRFERGIDAGFTAMGAEIAVALILELCGGTASALVTAGGPPFSPKAIPFDARNVETLGGLTLAPGKAGTILGALGFVIHDGVVTPPSWRGDIDGPADLVEEVLRIAGYDAIAAAPLPAPALPAMPLALAVRMQLLRRTLAVSGLQEIYSWAFVGERAAQLFGGGDASLRLLNPISSELAVMRPNLLPNLIAAAARNAARGFGDIALFEIGNVFENPTQAGQKMMAAGLRGGRAIARNVFKGERPVDAFDAKADLFAVLAALGYNGAALHTDREVPGWYHPARSGRLSLGGKVTLGYFGELHPRVLKDYDLETPLAAFELSLDAVPAAKTKSKTRPPLALSNFQAAERDFAFLAEAKLPVADIVKAIESADRQLIQAVCIFDVYQGTSIEDGKKSVALAVTLQAADRTLKDEDIEQASARIIAAAARLGLILRR